MTEQQKRILLSKLAATIEKDVPDSAEWHFRHKPYLERKYQEERRNSQATNTYVNTEIRQTARNGGYNGEREKDNTEVAAGNPCA